MFKKNNLVSNNNSLITIIVCFLCPFFYSKSIPACFTLTYFTISG